MKVTHDAFRNNREVKVIGMSTGHKLARESVLLADGDSEKYRKISVISWLIIGPTVIVVDTGLSRNVIPGNESKFMVEDDIASRIADCGVKISDVEYVLLTHLHHDHCENIDVFQNATVVLSAVGWRWLMSLENEVQEKDFPRKRLSSWIEARKNRVILANDGENVAPNISVMYSGGHSPCSVIYRMQCNEGTYVFTGDEMMVNDAYARGIRVGLSMNAGRSNKSVNYIKNNAVGVFCSHDPMDEGRIEILHQ